MNRYSRVLHHISICDVKKTKLRLENNRKSFLESVRKAREFLRDLNSPYYSDWRNANIKEGMTTGSVFFTTFPATGSDTNLETIAANDTDAYTGAGGLDALNGTSVKASGSGSGTDGGFDLGQSYLAFDGNVDSRHAILDPIDSSKFDTLVINAIVGNDSNGGEDPDEAGEELRLYYLEPGGSSFRSISVNPNGEQVLSANADVLIDLGAGDGSLQQFSIGLPSHARGEGFTYMLYQLSNSGEEFDHYGITSIKYQRRNPISLAVSLDSPEAVSMIRDGGNLTPAEKKKRLEDMLAASDEYMETQFPTNQEAMRRAEENLRRNIDISLDPNTFKFPEYGTPTYNQMFDAKIEAGSSTVEIERALEQKGLTLDNLSKDFNSRYGRFSNVSRDQTLILLNNTSTQEKTLTAMGIDPGLVKNLTPDSYDKIGKIANLSPGGTPATGWDGKFYEYGDPQLEASQVIPLETYTRIKGTDDFAGIEKPDRVEPGKRYVMEKKYSFTPDNEATPNYVGVRNKDIEQRINNNRVFALAYAGDSIGGHSWDYNFYTGSDKHLGGSQYMLRELAGSAAKSLNYINQNSDSLAYEFLRQYQDGERGGVYKNVYGQYKETDVFNNYDPLWIWNSDPKLSSMLTLLRGISSGRSLDSPLEYYTSNVASAESKRRAELNHQRQNDRLYDNLQKALKLFDSPRTLSQYEKDEWYLERDSNDRVTEVRTTHPYADMMSQQQPQPSEPDDSYMNIQVGDEQIIKQGNETILDTMRGIDNRQKNAIESELDRIKKMPPDVRAELERLLNIAGTSEYTPTSPKTKKEIEDYWASLPPEVLSDIEGRTQAHGVDALGLAAAILLGLGLGAPGVGATLKGAILGGLSKLKKFMKAKPKPTKAKYPTSTTSANQSLEKTLTSQKTLNAAREAIRKGGRNANITVKVNGKPFELKADHVLNRPGYNRPPSYSRGTTAMGDRWEGPLMNSHQPQGDSLMDNYEPKAKHNEKINNHPKIKSPKEFFKKADIKPVYPDTPPPEMINGRHPDLVDDTKIAKRFTKLDPESAKAMPNTGSPQIDALVRAARKKPK